MGKLELTFIFYFFLILWCSNKFPKFGKVVGILIGCMILISLVWGLIELIPFILINIISSLLSISILMGLFFGLINFMQWLEKRKLKKL